MVSGVAGMLADALSMGSSGYLAAKSEREVYEHEMAMEAAEITLMPEVEADELALLYEAKGIERDAAQRMAREVIADPERALAEKAREELGIGEQTSTPLKEGWITAWPPRWARSSGCAIPLPARSGGDLDSFGVAMLSHFAVGAARSVFTGRGLLRSGWTCSRWGWAWRWSVTSLAT